MIAMTALTWLTRVPVEPDRDQARSWALDELSRPEYQKARPGLISRGLAWIWDKLSLLDFGTGASPGIGLAVVGMVVGAVIVYVLYRAGGLRRSARRATGRVFADTITSAADHRAAAAAHASAGEWDLAVVERFRAIARELEERALLTPQPGRTAVEIATDGGEQLPDLAPALLTAAHHFDDVSYGHLSVGRPVYQALGELDDRLRAARVVAPL